MFSMKIALAILLFAQLTASQVPLTNYIRPSERCTIAVKDSPTIRGLKLGMDRADVLKTLPKEHSLALDLYKQPGFEGVRSLDLDYYKEKLSGFTVTYTHTVAWDGFQEFADSLSESLKLPEKYWRASGAWRGLMQCNEFLIQIDASNHTVELIDLLAVSEIEKEKKAEEDRKKKAFKP